MSVDVGLAGWRRKPIAFPEEAVDRASTARITYDAPWNESHAKIFSKTVKIKTHD
jgi:hypothetical protein